MSTFKHKDFKEKVLKIDARFIKNGISIKVKGRDFPIEYPQEIWDKTPETVRQMLLDNLTFGNTHFLPLTLGYNKIEYNIKFPLMEAFLFRNQIMDMLKSEEWDDAPHQSYLKQFYNLEFSFAPGSPVLFPNDYPKFTNKQPTAVIPFTFGKESLTTFALCRELGIKPILVYSQEPCQPFEEEYKKKKLAEYQEKYGAVVHFVKNGPGLFRYDAAFKKKRGTEVGWGSQTTMVALQVIPFVLAYQAQYVFFGSEYLTNNYYGLKNGWKVFISYDQTSFFTKHQDAMVRLMTGDQCKVRSSLEPIDQINIFHLLQTRYPELGKSQFSCTAEYPLYKDSQWCNKCYKCTRMYLFARACNIDPESVGFKKDLLADTKLWGNYFGKEHKSGVPEELDFAFYILHRRGDQSACVKLFEKTKLSKAKKWKELFNQFTLIHPELNLPEEYRAKLLDIFQDDLNSFRKEIAKS